jgi:hypothetical protein
MSGLRLDMSRLYRICPVWSQICSITRNFEQRKNILGAKTMCLGPDKLTISKLDNIEFKELMGTTRSNQNSRNQT